MPGLLAPADVASVRKDRAEAARKRWRCLRALLAVLAVGQSVLTAAEDRPRVAVFDIAANGTSHDLASAVATSVASELDRLGAFRVVTAEAVRSLLAYEKQRQMLGCTDAGCVAELAGALGADYVVTGKVTHLAGFGGTKDTVTLDLTLLAAGNGERAGSAHEEAASEAGLMARVPHAVARLTSGVLSARAGRLLISASELGAVVEIDGVTVGTTPIRTALVLPAGPHDMLVEKKGFVSHQKTVHIDPEQITEERVVLVPSPDFVRDYESHERKLRTGAWITSGVAVLGLVATVVLQVNANNLYGNPSLPGTFSYDRQRIQSGITVENGVDLRAQASRLRSHIETDDTLSYCAGGLAAAAAAGAIWLWVAGDDPNRYAPYHEAGPRVSIGPGPSGASVTLRAQF